VVSLACDWTQSWSFANGWAHSAPFAAATVFTSAANAAPPTVTPSPGYDARLQEQRAAQTFYQPVVRYPRPVSRRHMKQTHHGAH